MPFVGFHTDTKSSCAPDPAYNGLKGTVQEVIVLTQSKSNVLVRVLKTGHQINFSKWPLKHWGKLRGVFDTRKEAQEYLDKPSPKFDHDGNFINKISKSDQP